MVSSKQSDTDFNGKKTDLTANNKRKKGLNKDARNVKDAAS
jgi:hypothetical protein